MTGWPLRDEQRASKRLRLQQAAQRAWQEWEDLKASHHP